MKNFHTSDADMHQTQLNTELENRIEENAQPKFVIRYLEACAGIGVLSLVLQIIAQRLGLTFICEAISEIDKYAIDAFQALNGAVHNLGDLSKVVWSKISASLVSITFPCQDVSNAGTKKGFEEGSDTRSSLIWTIRKMLSEMPIKPKIIFMENVGAILNKRNKPTFDKVVAYLESEGYFVHYHKINAKDYGIPQNRERVFIICTLGHDVIFTPPKPKPLKFTLAQILEKDVDDKYYLKSLREFFIKHSMESPYTLRVMNPSHCDIAYTVTTKSGSRISDNFIFEKDISTDKVVRVKETSLDKSGISLDDVNSTRIRKLTPREVMLLFGFNEEQIGKLSHLSDATIYKLMGNSIVIDALVEYLTAFFMAYMEQVLKIPVDNSKEVETPSCEPNVMPKCINEDLHGISCTNTKENLETILDNHSRLQKINNSRMNSELYEMYVGFHNSFEFTHKGALIKVVQQVIDYGDDVRYCITYFHNGKPRNHNISFIRGIYEDLCYEARARPNTFLSNTHLMRAKDYAKAIYDVIDLHTQMKNCYFYHAPTKAINRRIYEQQHSHTSTFFYDGHRYDIKQITLCSCKNVYYKMHIYQDGKALDKDIRFIEALRKKLCNYIE